jgi:hypothetical protein
MNTKNFVFKSLCIVLWLSLSFTSVSAQKHWELKLNLLPLVNSTPVELSGEYLLNNKWGIEAGIGYDESKSGRSVLDSVSGNFISTPTGAYSEINFYAGIKYYFLKKAKGDRLFATAMLYRQLYTRYERFDIEVEKTPKGAYAFGAELGYKWLLLERIPIEFSVRLLSGRESSVGGENLPLLDGMLNGKIGYRF